MYVEKVDDISAIGTCIICSGSNILIVRKAEVQFLYTGRVAGAATYRGRYGIAFFFHLLREAHWMSVLLLFWSFLDTWVYRNKDFYFL